MNGRTLILRYAGFAVVATVVNLAAQRLVLQFGQTAFLFACAVGCGTLSGLVTKYLLDKRWIFFDTETGLRNHSRKFSLYAVMGIVTTLVFWGFETVFWMIWQTDHMRELGAILGLSIGYMVKYRLDRRFVFATGREVLAS
jgi:putative flippase GtrA